MNALPRQNNGRAFSKQTATMQSIPNDAKSDSRLFHQALRTETVLREEPTLATLEMGSVMR